MMALDVRLPLQIANANGAIGQVSGHCLYARSPPEANIRREELNGRSRLGAGIPSSSVLG